MITYERTEPWAGPRSWADNPSRGPICVHSIKFDRSFYIYEVVSFYESGIRTPCTREKPWRNYNNDDVTNGHAINYKKGAFGPTANVKVGWVRHLTILTELHATSSFHHEEV